MTIVFSNLGASANPDLDDDGPGTLFANGIWTPPASGLILAFVTSREAAGNNGPPNFFGNDLTWVQVATMTWENGLRRTTLFAADAEGAVADETEADFAPDSQDFCTMFFMRATGVDLAQGVANAFIQVVTGSGVDTSGSIGFALPIHPENRPVACFSIAAANAITPRANWTEMDEWVGVGGPSRNMETQIRADAFEDTASASWGVSTNWGGMAVELKAKVVFAPITVHVRPKKTTVTCREK
jgi:hypothetical protein